MADATTNVAADAANLRIPVVILYASIPALVTMGFAGVSVALEASKGFLIASMVCAIIGGCGVLAALVIHSNRKTARAGEDRILAALDARLNQAEIDRLNILEGVVKSHELGLKNAKATRAIATGLADCKVQITSEVEKLRVAQYTLAAENGMGSIGTAGPRLRSVDN